MQRGSLRKQNGAWHLRYRVTEVKDGKPVSRQIDKVLARVSDDYRSRSDVWPLADKILATVNRGAGANGGLSLTEFTEQHFLPYVEQKKKPSTVKFYREVHNNHLRTRVGAIRLRDFSTRDAQAVLDAIPLSHQSLLRIKTGMSAIFSYATRLGIVEQNPVREAKAEGKRSDPQRYAYTLAEVQWMLENLPEPARTVVAVAAFTGLRESEIRGLRWEDYDGQVLHVRRSIWRTHVGETKTPESKNAVPVIAPLRKIIDAHRKTLNGAGGWMFQGAKKRFALHLDNLRARDMEPVLGDRWHGWHAFRRGIATNLFTLGVPAEVTQTILRHANVATTQAHYIVLESTKAGRDAMQRLERAVSRGANVGQPKPQRRKSPHKHSTRPR
jgi:integrase